MKNNGCGCDLSRQFKPVAFMHDSGFLITNEARSKATNCLDFSRGGIYQPPMRQRGRNQYERELAAIRIKIHGNERELVAHVTSYIDVQQACE